MFTGLVQCMGIVRDLQLLGRDVQLVVEANALAPALVNTGDSVAVNGACLTVVENQDYLLCFDVSAETLAVTNLGGLVVGNEVNLELPLSLSDRLGGHLVTGHVDGVAMLVSKDTLGGSEKMQFKAPPALDNFIAVKGSICVDGVSLTINDVDGGGFWVNVVPHTLKATTLGNLRVEDKVHIEVDLIARYLQSLLLRNAGVAGESEGITRKFLVDSGFLAPDLDVDEFESGDPEP